MIVQREDAVSAGASSAAQSVLAGIGEPGAFGGNPPFWAEAMSAMPAGPLPFLDPAVLSARREAARLPPERDGVLADVAKTVASDEALSRFAWYLHWRAFIVPERGSPWGAPTLAGRLGDRAGMFYELLALEFAPRLAAWHRRLGYPSQTTHHTVLQVSSYEGNHLRGRGRPGIYESQFAWLATYLVCPYVRLGRLEFQLHPYGGGVSAWRRPSDGQILALAENGTRVAADGLRLAGDASANEGWTATLEEMPETVVGFPVDPAGRILRSQVRLARPDWLPCLRRGATVLDLHIPAGGGMAWKAVVDSFRQALEFFRRYHADQPFVALVVGTWFMDPRLQEALPREANPLRLQRAVYLYPTPPGPGGLWFVFLRDMARADPAALPRDTSLQRRLVSFLQSGRTWNGGGMLLLPEDMADPREGLYRERFSALRAELGLA
jgi:hypothetical protein